MNYLSTRGEAPVLSFTEALLAGLARDGGLYVPQSYPQLSKAEIAGFAGLPYAEVAESVIGPFTGGEIHAHDFTRMVHEAYGTFRHSAVTPLAQVGDNLFILELFHGPTLAFKDVAMQLLGRMMDHVLKAQGRRATIVGATSGDTGAAAIEAFRGLEQVDVFIMYPHGRVSDVQRRQMTTITAPNVHNIAVQGTFDDCQDLAKACFNDLAFRDRHALTAVNSINFARVMAQIVYYFWAALKLGAPDPRTVVAKGSSGSYGGVGRNHWAFQPVQKPALPAVANAAWCKNPVDNFVLAKLEGNGLAPNTPADKSTLIRRVTFDLDEHAVFHTNEASQLTLALMRIGILDEHGGLPVGAIRYQGCIGLNLALNALFFKDLFNVQHLLNLTADGVLVFKLQGHVCTQLHAAQLAVGY